MGSKAISGDLAFGFAWLLWSGAGVGRGKMPRLQGLFAQLISFSRFIPPYSYNPCVGDADLRPLQCPSQSWDGTGPLPYIKASGGIPFVI